MTNDSYDDVLEELIIKWGGGDPFSPEIRLGFMFCQSFLISAYQKKMEKAKFKRLEEKVQQQQARQAAKMDKELNQMRQQMAQMQASQNSKPRFVEEDVPDISGPTMSAEQVENLLREQFMDDESIPELNPDDIEITSDTNSVDFEEPKKKAPPSKRGRPPKAKPNTVKIDV